MSQPNSSELAQPEVEVSESSEQTAQGSLEVQADPRPVLVAKRKIIPKKKTVEKVANSAFIHPSSLYRPTIPVRCRPNISNVMPIIEMVADVVTAPFPATQRAEFTLALKRAFVHNLACFLDTDLKSLDPTIDPYGQFPLWIPHPLALLVSSFGKYSVPNQVGSYLIPCRNWLLDQFHEYRFDFGGNDLNRDYPVFCGKYEHFRERATRGFANNWVEKSNGISLLHTGVHERPEGSYVVCSGDLNRLQELLAGMLKFRKFHLLEVDGEEHAESHVLVPEIDAIDINAYAMLTTTHRGSRIVTPAVFVNEFIHSTIRRA